MRVRFTSFILFFLKRGYPVGIVLGSLLLFVAIPDAGARVFGLAVRISLVLIAAAFNYGRLKDKRNREDDNT